MKLRIAGHSTRAELKQDIQNLLRSIVILRDGGCFLRNCRDKINPQYQDCGGLTKNGELILQAEHLHSRANAISFSDSRLVVCVCKRHHIFYKPQYSAEYNELARDFIGKARTELWEKVKNDHSIYKTDLKLEKIALENELKRLRQMTNS